MTRVVIVGGGIVGCAAAYFCTREDMDVTLVESERIAYGASGRNPGFVWLHCRNPGFGLQVSLAGRALYDELLTELPPFGFRPNGGLIYFTQPEQAAAFGEFAAARREHGLPMELIDGSWCGRSGRTCSVPASAPWTRRSRRRCWCSGLLRRRPSRAPRFWNTRACEE
ncbi:MAG: FAD-binding oxidoreductase [Chloroflexi bacterium]|nr:MAG: FAD-binding oxidoreductase [Chloroflexota bacterium]